MQIRKIIIHIIYGILILASGFLGYNIHTVYQAYSKVSQTPSSLVLTSLAPTVQEEKKSHSETSGKEIIVFFDYSCPACHTAYNILRELHELHPEVHIILRPFPRMGPQSDKIARMALAAAQKGKFWEFNDVFINNTKPLNDQRIHTLLLQAGLNPGAIKENMNTDFVKSQIDETFAIARSLNIGGTPTFVVDSDIFIFPVEDPTINDFRKMLDIQVPNKE